MRGESPIVPGVKSVIAYKETKSSGDVGMNHDRDHVEPPDSQPLPLWHRVRTELQIRTRTSFTRQSPSFTRKRMPDPPTNGTAARQGRHRITPHSAKTRLSRSLTSHIAILLRFQFKPINPHQIRCLYNECLFFLKGVE